MRALIGTALTPAFPISGFSFLPFGKKRFISLTNKIPLADAMMKARAPRAKILMVFNVRNSEAWVEQPTVRPRRITTISFKLLLAVLASRVVFPLSFRRFPKNSIPSNGKPDGTMKVVDKNENLDKGFNRIGIRRGRMKFEYNDGIGTGAVQIEVNDKGVSFRSFRRSIPFTKQRVPRIHSSRRKQDFRFNRWSSG